MVAHDVFLALKCFQTAWILLETQAV
jgi:hypothetical protein